MANFGEVVDIDVELNKADVEWLDQEAVRLGCTRNDLICLAVDCYLDRLGQQSAPREPKSDKRGNTSRTGHTADKPPTTG